MKILTLFSALAALFMIGCSSDDYEPYATRGLQRFDVEERDEFTLRRTACFGFCPIYQVTVDERDLLLFQGERFVTEAGGAVSKRLPDGSFNRIVAIAKEHGVAGFDARYPNDAGDNCAALSTDSPNVEIEFKTKRIAHAVAVNLGCAGFDGRDRFEAMVAAIEEVLDIDSWIGPREDFYGAKE